VDKSYWHGKIIDWGTTAHSSVHLEFESMRKMRVRMKPGREEKVTTYKRNLRVFLRSVDFSVGSNVLNGSNRAWRNIRALLIPHQRIVY
jgi:hypothetical protein